MVSDFTHRFTRLFGNYQAFLIAILVLVGLLWIGAVRYLLFHTLAELFSVLIAFTIFVLTWNGRRFIHNGSLLFFGISFLFVGAMDLLHTLAFKGMNIFEDSVNANFATQLWLCARYLQAIGLVGAPLFLNRRFNLKLVFSGFTLVFVFLLFLVFNGYFPISLIEGRGLTPFKIASEFAVIACYLIGIAMLFRIRNSFDSDVLNLIGFFVVFNVLAEFFFTQYLDPYDFRNFLGHYFKIISFYLIYKAIIVTGFLKPQDILFRELAQNEKALRESEARERERALELEAIMDAVPAVVWISHDPKSDKVTGNRAAVELLRVDGGTNLSKTTKDGKAPSHFRVFQNGKELASSDQPLQISAATGRYIRDFEETLIFEDGKKFHLLGNVTPLVNDKGQPSGAVSAFIDITERVRTELALQEYMAQLERSNRELQDFAFVASHDLQEPLRKIQAFGDRLNTILEDKLDEETSDYLKRMLNAASRMRNMINDLLELSRVTTRGKPFVTVDLNDVVDEVVSDLEYRLKMSEGNVEVGRLPMVEADPIQMHQLFQNLIGNGLKFHPPAIQPKVNIWSEGEADQHHVRIFIKDNGIGFEEQYIDRIFQPFQRLHGAGQYEGSGIGLAICRKIVERHSGMITALSSPGEGSTFIVTLSSRQK